MDGVGAAAGTTQRIDWRIGQRGEGAELVLLRTHPAGSRHHREIGAEPNDTSNLHVLLSHAR
jgi:hypothetical protein